MEINGELLEHALDGLGLLEPDAEGKLGPLGAEGHAARPDIRPPDPILQITISFIVATSFFVCFSGSAGRVSLS